MKNSSKRFKQKISNSLNVATMVMGLSISSAISLPVWASDAVHQFEISAGPLSQTLHQLALTSGITLAFEPEQVAGKTAAALQGSFTPEAALETVLRGSGLQVRSVAGGYTLVPEGAAADVVEPDPDTPADKILKLVPLAVDSTALPSTTEGTNSYTTGSMNTATRLGLSIRETPQSVSVITRQMIDDMQLESLTDVVNTVTGVTSTALDSSRNSFSARGFDISSYQVDGVPTSWQGGYESGQSQIDTLLYDRVEVVRGASGLIAGAGNPSAAINLVRKRADSKEFIGHASISAGSWDRYQGTVDVSTPLNEAGSVRGRLVGSYLDERSFVDAAENEKTLFYGTLAADLTDSTLLNVGISYQDNDPRGTTWGGLPAWFSDGTRTNWSRSKTTAPDWATWASDNTNYFANIEHVFDSGARVYAAYSKSIQNADLRLLYPLGLPDINTGEGMGPLLAWYDYKREQDTIDIYGSVPFSFAGQNHEVTLGFMHSKQDFVADTRGALNPAAIGNFYDWNPSAYPKPQWGEKSLNRKEKTKQVGGYAVARLSLADSLKLIIGSRVTNWETDIEYGDGSGDRINHHQVVTPYAGLIYDINDVYSAYVSYTDIFNPQNARDISGKYLDPIEGKNYEAGLKAEYLQGRLNATFSVFRIEQDNLAQADGNNFVTGTNEQAYTAAEGATSKGFEVEVSGAITNNWNMLVGWSQFRVEDADGTAVNTDHPRRTATLFTTYQLDQLTLGGGVNWESSNYTMATNPLGQAEKLKQDGYALVRLMARYQVTPALSAQLNINNLFDKKYYTNIGAFSQLAYGAPRNANLTLRYDF
ncbi:OMR family iron-siderophore receptor precursor [Methylophaga lonarensis MPL]|uniref:OMR family iron-siderophore receptor n=1 Tax=Methylophaga lonarensis MPL TaxID=1286106 RepID=M7NTV3_9GAMM|nr:ferric-rhodotorulic acid/ferric-coprogen receptor FhuE [Methylophaga lonarensis]EMR12198.1 OMR family iron-siderophore receptor precursor [Methylophaga lonarensis MPL]